jgi:hypothetical protein
MKTPRLGGIAPLCLLALTLGLASPGRADTEPLHHYGVAALKDGGAEAAFAARFNAQGRPLFLIGDLGKGVALGDIIRFKDKVVLINEEVWQTMKATGVLDGIRNAPVVELSARSTSGVWKSRAELAGGREKIAYTLGAEFITILEEYFGAIPERMELAFRFEGDRMTILAPTEMLGVLNFTARSEKGKKAASDPAPDPKARPRIVSEPPRRAFSGEAFAWTVWAVDPGQPSADLAYSVQSRLPPGLAWDEARHALTGRPTRPGRYEIKVKAVNAAKRADELAFDLAVAQNQPPRIWGEPDRKASPDGSWRFQPLIADPDHYSAELKVEPLALPAGLAFDRETRAFTMKGAPEESGAGGGELSFGLKVTDPMGASEQRTFRFSPDISAGSDLRFRSALGVATVMEGERSFYAAVAVGPGKDIRYRATRSGGGPLDLPDGRLSLATGSPGAHEVELTAEDELGNRATQTVSYRVVPRAPGLLRDLSLSTRNLGGTALYDAHYRAGRSRYGTLKAGPWDASLPFLFVGFEPVPEGLAGGRHTLFLDLGLNVQGSSGVTYGGLMARLDGRYNRFGEDAFVFRYQAHYHARQGIVLLDPQDYRDNDVGDSKLEKCLQELRSRTDRTDSLVSGFLACDDGARSMVDAYGSGSNEVFLVRLEMWAHAGRSVYVGPVYWLEDHFHSRDVFEQRLGLGLTRSTAFGWFGVDATAKVGFAPTGPAAKFLFDLSLRFGRDG